MKTERIVGIMLGLLSIFCLMSANLFSNMELNEYKEEVKCIDANHNEILRQTCIESFDMRGTELALVGIAFVFLAMSLMFILSSKTEKTTK